MDRRQDELAHLIGRHATADGVHRTRIPRLSLIRISRPTEPLHRLYAPEFCIFAQGKKEVFVGGEVYTCDRDRNLVVSVDLPVVGQIVEASPEVPYLGLQLDLDPAMLGGLMLEAKMEAANGRSPGSGLAPGANSLELLDAVVRLLRLLDTPRDAGILAPLAEREILYRLLTGEQGRTLGQIALSDGKVGQVGRAISWIKDHYREPFRVEDVAVEARMSSSALHQHFKAVTSLSPLQYQKRLRLQEARRLMLGSSLDAATAGFAVGYESASQFSREYRRLFGAPPLRDSEKMKHPRLQT